MPLAEVEVEGSSSRLVSNDIVRIAVIAIVAVAVARFVVPRIPVVGPKVGGFL